MKYSTQTKSHLVFNSIALIALFFGLQTIIVRAQSAGFEAGLAGQAANMNSNVIGMNAIAIAAEREADQRGAQRIRVGKATLQFTSTYAGTAALVKDYNFYPESPQDVPGQVKLVQEYVSRFNQLMTKAGYEPNNMVDGMVFSYSLAYIVYYGEKPDAVKLNQWRQNWSQEYLTNAHFQSLPDSVRQYRYEDRAFMAMQAVDEKVKIKTASTQQERELLTERALGHAKYVLDLVK